jgi:signal transduction histidine kinase
MTAVSIRLAALRRRITDRSLTESVEMLEESVSIAMQRLRALTSQLHPPALANEGGLVSALREQLTGLETERGLECTLEGRMPEPTSFEARTICFRVAQEAFWNVRTHAEASRVDVLVERREGGIFVRIRDDGVGFSFDGRSSSSGHLGLDSMKEWTEMAGGWLRLESGPGRGTTVEYWVPAQPG